MKANSVVLIVAALVASYLATPATNHVAVAALHRRKQKLVDSGDLEGEDLEAVESVFRAAEVAHPTDDAKAAAEKLAPVLEAEDEEGEDVGKSATTDPNPNPSGAGAAGSQTGGDGV